MKNMYLLYDDYRIGYVKGICECKECKKRNDPELLINTLDDEWLDSIPVSKLASKWSNREILTCGNSVNEILNWIKQYIINPKDKEIEFLELVNEYLNK
jgi:Na+/phosphate symporter